MSRRYKREVFASRVEKIKSIMPHACIGADVIVGFPAESDDDFQITFDFLEQLDLSYLHVFPYSERPNTKAILIGNKVDPSKKERRSKLLGELSELKRKKFYLANQGRQESVIFESRMKGGLMTGFSSNYIKVEASYKKELIGVITPIMLKNISSTGNYQVEI
jgi:threonylcarbamoyladenosine tRNA methylthiotransferase MtaB